MKITLTLEMFRDEIARSYAAMWYSHAGINSIFSDVEDQEDNSGREMEFDLSLIGDAYSEYGNMKELIADGFHPDVNRTIETATGSIILCY